MRSTNENISYLTTANGLKDYSLYIKKIKDIKTLTAEEEKLLAKKSKKGDLSAREKLIISNLKLVIKIAMHFYKNGFNLMDLIQEGNVGLIIAVDKFDYKQHYKFSTYASWWIRHYILKAILSKINIIEFPMKKNQLVRQLEQIYEYWEKNYHKEPSLSDIKKILNISKKKITELVRLSNYTFSSLENYFPEHMEIDLLEQLKDKEKYEPEKIIFENLLNEDTEKMLKSLMDREATVLKYRYGLVNGKPYSLKEIGRMLGLSGEAIRQMENKVLKKLRKKYFHLKDYLIN